MRIISIAFSFVLFASVFCLLGACYNPIMNASADGKMSVLNLAPDEIFITGFTLEDGKMEHYWSEKSLHTVNEPIDIVRKYSVDYDQIPTKQMVIDEFSLLNATLLSNRSSLSITRSTGNSELLFNLSNKGYPHFDRYDIKQLRMIKHHASQKRHTQYSLSASESDNTIIILNP